MAADNTVQPKYLVEDLLLIAEEFMLREGGQEKLGVALMDMLTMAAQFCRESEWYQALRLCEFGSGVTGIGNEYRGSGMDPFIALGFVNYYYGTAYVGDNDFDAAHKYLKMSREQFKSASSSQLPAACVWLAIAEIHTSQKNFHEAMWALQRSKNLIESKPGRLAENFRRRIENEYNEAKQGLDQFVRGTSRSTVEKSLDSTRTAEAIGQQHSRGPHIPPFVEGQNLLAFPIFGSLAAGKPIWQPDSNKIEDFAEVDTLLIHSRQYQFFNLRDNSSAIRMHRNRRYALYAVKGNSMNALKSKVRNSTGLEDGDYVLISADQNGSYDPEDGDLVAAAITDVTGRRGVVKRFRISRGKGLLESESTDPQEPNFDFESNEIEIFGQVIAVLKWTGDGLSPMFEPVVGPVT